MVKIEKIQKSFEWLVPGPGQYENKRYSTTVTASVPPEAQEPTPEGKKAFIEASDTLQKIARALVERDAAQK